MITRGAYVQLIPLRSRNADQNDSRDSKKRKHTDVWLDFLAQSSVKFAEKMRAISYGNSSKNVGEKICLKIFLKW